MIADDLPEIIQKVLTTARTSFPEATFENFMDKMHEEVDEAYEAVPSKRLGELVDQQIVLWSALDRAGYTAAELFHGVAFKDAVNSKRKWERLPDGTYKHIEGH